jgi:hypothetical protein
VTDCIIPPSGYTTDDVLTIIDRCAGMLGSHFSFGYMTPEDVAQEARIYGLELLQKGTYQPGRDLSGYVFQHLRRRLTNLKRNLFHRSDPPCRRCNGGDYCCAPGPCPKQAQWERRNARKATLTGAGFDGTGVGTEPGGSETEVESAVQANELNELLDANLPVDLRADFLRMKAGEPVTPDRRRHVQEAVLAVLNEAGLSLEDFGL